MTDQELMQAAIEEAKKSAEPLPCGVVIAKDGEIIARGFNSQRHDHNATAHAEIQAIGRAGKILGDKNLYDCTIYCTCEPCTMCLSAILFAHIPKLYYGASINEVSPLRIEIDIDDFLAKTHDTLELHKSFMRTEVMDALYHEFAAAG